MMGYTAIRFKIQTCWFNGKTILNKLRKVFWKLAGLKFEKSFICFGDKMSKKLTSKNAAVVEFEKNSIQDDHSKIIDRKNKEKPV